jgi:hypothetical protein
MTVRSRPVLPLALLLLVVVAAPRAAAQAPASTSAAPVKELLTLLEPRLEAGMAFIAAKTDQPGVYAAALYLQSVPQLLVVTATYDPAQLFDERLAKHDYREAYTDLNSASKVGTRVFYEDLKADGLLPERSGSDPFDMLTAADGKRVQFDGDPKKQKMSDEEYAAAFKAADAAYAKAVQALVAQAKKKGS